MKFVILYGTESGNAETVADDLVDELSADNEVESIDMTDVEIDTLTPDAFFLVVCSTHGDGGLPARPGRSGGAGRYLGLLGGGVRGGEGQRGEPHEDQGSGATASRPSARASIRVSRPASRGRVVRLDPRGPAC